MNRPVFDPGEVDLLQGSRYARRVGYFLLVTLLVVPGAAMAARDLLLSPLDALYVLPIAFLGTALGANTALHMYFTHRSFTTGPVFKALLALLSTILCQDPIGQWIANHKRHHRHVDIPGKDPHTPRQFGESPLRIMTLGLFWASAGWKFSRIRTSKTFYASQLVADPIGAWFDRHFVPISLAGLALPFVIGWLVGGTEIGLKWFGYFGALRVFIGFFFTEFVVNGLCHVAGSTKFDIRGHSTNIVWMSPLTLGATLHHNHHAFPRVLSPAIDSEIDPMKLLYRLLEKIGVMCIEPDPLPEQIVVKKIRRPRNLLRDLRP